MSNKTDKKDVLDSLIEQFKKSFAKEDGINEDNINVDNLSRDPSSDELQSLMNDMLSGKKDRIGIEFECGDCCKKVLNGAKIFFASGQVILLPAHGDFLFMKIFSGGKLVDKQIMKAIIVPIKRLCAIEFQPIQIDS
ncbi:MAG: hypothetical protein ACOY46_17085 [Bacillota bacterium]